MTTTGKPKRRLSYCSTCNENSVATKVYNRKSDGKRCRVVFCINKGCGFKQEVPFPEDFLEPQNSLDPLLHASPSALARYR